MTSLVQDLRGVFSRHIECATPADLLAIASTLCGNHHPAADVNSRFQVMGDVVTDRSTGLTWSRENVPGGQMDWADAKAAVSKLSLAGYTDWRLPTVKELLSLVDYEKSAPAIDSSVFKCESAAYWTSTPYRPSPGADAWIVGFSYGYSYWGDQSGDYFVRAVRAGQLIRNWD